MSPFNLFETPVDPEDIGDGAIVYYADHHCFSNEYLHALQVCKVIVSTDKHFLLDNGRKFNSKTGAEITKGNGGVLYPYTPTTRAMVQDAQAKLFLVNEVVSINFSSLTTQQLSMILDVSRGAFTQVTAPTPCGGCGDTVQVAGIDIETTQAPEVTTTIAFNDATYELTQEELDEIEDADEDEEHGFEEVSTAFDADADVM